MDDRTRAISPVVQHSRSDDVHRACRAEV